MNKFAYIVFALAIGCMGLLSACGNDYKEAVKAEAVDAFTAVIDSSMAILDDDVARLDKELFENKEKQLKLEYVVAPAMEWTEVQEAEISKKLAGSWVRTLDPEWMSDKFTSDLYEVSSVTVRGTDMGGQREEITSEIIVKDLTSGAKSDWESFQADLEDQQAVFEQRRQAFMEQGRQVVSTFDNVIQNYDAWEVTKINDTTYQISGPGLGIPSEGSWVFYQDKGEIKPADEPAKSLNKVLTLQ